MHFEHPYHLIEQLIALLREDDFESIFLRLTEQLNSQQRLSLKMELNRKCTPCRQSIDMRNDDETQCVAHEFAGITHFMPANALMLFQSQCYLYQDSYTIGVYETLQNWQRARLAARPMSTATPNPYARYDVNTLIFGQYLNRREERMHFSSALILRVNEHDKVFAQSSDISVGGVRVCVPSHSPYQIGQEVSLLLTGLAKTLSHPALQQWICYQVLGKESKQGKNWLRLMRCHEMPAVDKVIRDFIEANKMRYRVSVDYLLSSALIKGHEQLYLPRMTGMPLFFTHTAVPTLAVALRTENNQHILHYWRDEKNRDVLAGLFHPARMSQLLSRTNAQPTLIYCFTHSVRSHLYFFSATEQELRQHSLKALFFHVGARRPSWRVYQFQWQRRQTATPVAAQGSLAQQDLQQRLNDLGYIGLLQELNQESLRHEFYPEQAPPENANALQCFAHSTTSPVFDIEMLHYLQLRKESRYLHKTPVAIHYAGQAWLGWTRDISTHGLQVELAQPFSGEPNALLVVALPNLQNLAKQMDLQKLQYRLVNINNAGTVLHLCIAGEADRHIGRQFFNQLISHNKDKLNPTPAQRSYKGLGRALRDLYCQHLCNHPFYINKSNASLEVASLACSPSPRTLSPLLQACASHDGQHNLFPLLQRELAKALIFNPLRQLEREDKPTEQEIYIAYYPNQAGFAAFDSQLASRFTHREEKRQFVKQAQAKGQFYSVLVQVSRTGRPDLQFIANELDYIATFAIHKAKQLEQQLWGIVGVGEFIDTTEATLLRLNIPSSQ